jgi:hypothetical protein
MRPRKCAHKIREKTERSRRGGEGEKEMEREEEKSKREIPLILFFSKSFSHTLYTLVYWMYGQASQLKVSLNNLNVGIIDISLYKEVMK